MGIQVEFNPDLALRSIVEAAAGRRNPAECIPNGLKAGQTHPFLKEGQRIYWFGGEIPLLETKGDQQLSRPIASIRIVEATHYAIASGKVWTRGTYEVVEVFTDHEVHFNGFARI
ncbi:MAG: hypothetical protein WC551_01025 [Patescibacteria group bacterium]